MCNNFRQKTSRNRQKISTGKLLICVSKKRQEILTKKIIASTEESSTMFCGNLGGGGYVWVWFAYRHVLSATEKLGFTRHWMVMFLRRSVLLPQFCFSPFFFLLSFFSPPPPPPRPHTKPLPPLRVFLLCPLSQHQLYNHWRSMFTPSDVWLFEVMTWLPVLQQIVCYHW